MKNQELFAEGTHNLLSQYFSEGDQAEATIESWNKGAELAPEKKEAPQSKPALVQKKAIAPNKTEVDEEDMPKHEIKLAQNVKIQGKEVHFLSKKPVEQEEGQVLSKSQHFDNDDVIFDASNVQIQFIPNVLPAETMEPVVETFDNPISSQFLSEVATAGAAAEQQMYYQSEEGKQEMAQMK